MESLRQEFAKNNVNVDIDAKTGALTLDAERCMFAYDEAELTEEGKAALRSVLPIYCKVLLEESHRPYLAEIIIDGYTDTDGDYSYNLELSQRRSLAVAQYLLEIQQEFLDESEIASLQDYSDGQRPFHGESCAGRRGQCGQGRFPPCGGEVPAEG